MEEIALLSDGFFNDSTGDQFDFDLSDVDQELFFESNTNYESVKATVIL